MNNKIIELEKLNRKFNPPECLSGVFLPRCSKKQFNFLFIGEKPSMNVPKNWDGECNYNFDVTARDKFFQEMMVKYKVDGSYVTDIVKKRGKPGEPTLEEIIEYRQDLLEEIKIIGPTAVVVIGRRTYENSFIPYIKDCISNKDIVVDYVFHYCSQVTRSKFEKKFNEVINRLKNKE